MGGELRGLSEAAKVRLTDAIASCKDALGFLPAELPKKRFIVDKQTGQNGLEE